MTLKRIYCINLHFCELVFRLLNNIFVNEIKALKMQENVLVAKHKTLPNKQNLNEDLGI